MKDGMFDTYTEAIGFLIAGAMISGVIVWIAVTAIQWVASQLYDWPSHYFTNIDKGGYMKETRIPSDVIKAIFHFIGQERFPAEVPKIQEAFYQISLEEKYSRLFNNIVYDTSGMFPYSSTILYALDRLQKSNLLACINPGLDEFEVSKALSAWDPKESKLFTQEEVDLLEEAAKEFKTLMRKN